MRARSVVMGLVPILALTAAWGAVVVAEDAVDPMAPAYFTFAEPVTEPAMGDEEPVSTKFAGEVRGDVEDGYLRATDPRASGRMVSNTNLNMLEVVGGGLAAGAASVRLVNEGGAWSGTSRALHFVVEDGGGVVMTTLTGEGGYEGLTLLMVQYADDEAQTRRGVIIPSDQVPPMPDVIELPDE